MAPWNRSAQSPDPEADLPRKALSEGLDGHVNGASLKLEWGLHTRLGALAFDHMMDRLGGQRVCSRPLIESVCSVV